MRNIIKIKCPAKVNLTLEIVNKREDGFHNIKSIMQTVSLCDYLSIEAKKAENSKKLLIFKVKSGNSERQIVSGIAKYYSHEEMLGKKVIYIANLKPAKLAGVLSEGMLLCAEDAEGNLALLTPEKPMPAGAEIA